MKKNRIVLIAALILALMLTDAVPASAETAAEHPLICISIRDYGDIYAELYPEYAPITVENFLKLVNDKFYDGLTFHRIISGFMIQGGDPLGNGTGGSAQTIMGEFSQNGVENPLKHDRGVLSMARSSDMNSASSQFFIMHANAPHLDGAYAAFGKVLCGMPAVDQVCLLTPVQDNNGTVLKADQPVISGIRVATAEEAEQAKAAEQANGRAGTEYRDPFTRASFRVAEGWNRTGYPQANTSFFQPAADPGKGMTMVGMDVWQRYADRLTQMGYTRETLDTEAAIKLGLIRVDTDTSAPHELGGAPFYRAAIQAESGERTIYIGAYHGCIYQFVFNGGSDDPYYADVSAMLDSLVFE